MTSGNGEDPGFYRGDSPVNGPDFGYGGGNHQMWPGSDLYGQNNSGVFPGATERIAPPVAPTTQFGYPPQQQFQAPPPRPRRNNTPLVAAILVLVLLIGGVVYFFVAQSENADTATESGPTAGASTTSDSGFWEASQGTGAVVPPLSVEGPGNSVAEIPGQVPTALTVGGESITSDSVNAEAPPNADGPPVVPVGQSATIQYEESTLSISVLGALWQPGSAWSQGWTPPDTGFLVVDIDVERLDGGTSDTSFVFTSWSFRTADGETVGAELIGGGYEPDVADVSLVSGQKAQGAITFATRSTSGVLTLSAFAGPAIGSWQVEAGAAEVSVATFGQAARSNVGDFPLEVTVQQPIWDSSADAVVGLSPDNGYWLYADYTAALPAETPATVTSSQASIRYDSWHFLPDVGGDYEGELGEIYLQQTSMVYVEPGVPGSGRFRIDAPGQAGTLVLMGQDGTVIMKWAVASP